MERIIEEWLVSNSSMIAIVAVVVLAIIGSWYLYSKRQLLKTVKEPENIEKLGKPEIVVFLRPHAACIQCLMLSIENIGTAPAYNVRFGTGSARAAPFITSASNFDDVRLLKENNFLQNEIGCFGPGQKIEQFLINLGGGLPEELKRPLQISVTYTDSQNHRDERRYTLDFGEFGSLVHVNSIEEKATSDVRDLFHVVQKGFSQVAESIEHLRLPQTSKPEGSEPPSQAGEEHPQSVQSEQSNPLSPELQEFVTLYNASDKAKLQEIYKNSCSFGVSNENSRLRNPNEPPVFETKSGKSFIGYVIDSENLYAVVPFFGCILQNDFYSSGAFGKVFECPGFDPAHTYHIEVVRPAFFKRDNEKWTLEERGKLELKRVHK